MGLGAIWATSARDGHKGAGLPGIPFGSGYERRDPCVVSGVQTHSWCRLTQGAVDERRPQGNLANKMRELG